MFLSVSASFTPSTTAIGSNVFMTALAGILPLLLFFVLLGAFKVKTHWCALISLIAAILIAVVGFKMPVTLSLLAAGQGIVFALIPIIYIIIAAVWLYNLTEVSGRSKDLRAVFNTIGKGDIRVQALIVAFSFCGLLEGLAGFGAPVAIVAAMLVSLGLRPVKAAVVTIVGNAINVGFGAMAIPATTAGRLGGQNPLLVAADMGHLSWIIACFVPLILLWILDGGRGVAQLWPLALISGIATAVGHFVTTGFSYELTAVLASLIGLAASYVFLLVWTPKTPDEYRSDDAQEDRPDGSRITLALLPYVLVVVVIALTKLWKIGVDIDSVFKATDIKIPVPGLHGVLVDAKGQAVSSTIYTFQFLSNPGTWIFVTAIAVAFIYGRTSSGGRFPMTFGKGIATLFKTISTLKISILTICLVMGLAYVMNMSGQTGAIGAALATTGILFAFLSPILGWLGTAVAGSATSAGALFANLQSTAAQIAGLDPATLLAGNTIGGGIGKIVSPQNLTIAATAINEPGSEAEILKKAAPYSIALLVILCILIFLASQGYLGSYMPDPASFAN
ncbi:L-lactate permease [uncultured Actinomyces sp.]|uniref:L-lactate permease n=1 Tax=uncultured Actinomyces sp. TaxID=249061 RepID=UPI0025E3E7F9|nr:lactate permease LctP family transporter [uncultured Actinomyces sp.]